MDESKQEGCAICWRMFSSTIIPEVLLCGHSFCQSCSEQLKKCPLCRKRISHARGRATNYSLLSLMEKMEKANVEVLDQNTQTDEVRSVTPRGRVRRPQNTDQTPEANCQLKQLRFKLLRDKSGGVRGLEFNLY